MIFVLCVVKQKIYICMIIIKYIYVYNKNKNNIVINICVI